ncbi:MULTISPECIES: HK97 gp10 family phage protein [Lysinibacillus]|uniref:HK97 gp10 family phage protein n=1 Tax=Lysinibacillus TaxID=400634 RepID=UPI002161295B|nr:HK97 gp10 family phage protein [Lysinibacillus sphaericus]MCS1382731.1 HK97 gp10 family phage protein [Lysinibacillus sphaericus]
MGRGGRVDYRELKAFEKRLEKLAKADYEKFCEACAKELAARLLAKVIKRTPVNDGVLRRGWTAKSHREAELTAALGGGTGSITFAKELNVKVTGDIYEIEIINPVDYSSYVEFGHRSRGNVGWVTGRFMMTISADELEQQAPTILQKKLYTMLKEAFNGD